MYISCDVAKIMRFMRFSQWSNKQAGCRARVLNLVLGHILKFGEVGWMEETNFTGAVS